MKGLRFFLLLLLIPNLLCARSLEEYYVDMREKALSDWKKSNDLIQKLNKLDPNNKEKYLHTLEETISHCKQAIKQYEKGLKEISRGLKDAHTYNTYTDYDQLIEFKKVFKKDQATCQARLTELENVLNQIRSYDKAKNLYDESIKKIEAAKSYPHPSRTIQNVEEVLNALNQVAKLYDEASSLLQSAHDQIPASSQGDDKTNIKQLAQDAKAAASRNRQEATEWQETILAQKNTLKNKAESLRQECIVYQEKGMQRPLYEAQKQLEPILVLLEEICTKDEKVEIHKELLQTKNDIEAFVTKADSLRLTQTLKTLTPSAFTTREKERRERFYTTNQLPAFLPNYWEEQNSRVFALDGQQQTAPKAFTLYSEQFYRFLLRHDSDVSALTVRVFENAQMLHEEQIVLPSSHAFSWNYYLVHDGMTFIPDTKLKSQFGLDLRIRFAPDPKGKSRLIITQKAESTQYQYVFSIDDKTPLYKCSYSAPPPWQLEALCKPTIFKATKPISKISSSKIKVENENGSLDQPICYPLLDELVTELKNDPIALAAYVQNEISLVTFSSVFENDYIKAPPILRNASITFLEKHGSPWEQCQLLVYLLRKAGYKALYTETFSTIDSDYAERLFFTKLPSWSQEELLLFPGVLLFNGTEWVSLFPWMKDIQINEGYNLYSYMPESYSSAERWILRYLKGDEKILKHLGPDGDDTAGVLFTLFAEDELRKQGLSFDDVGLHRRQRKHQFSSWEDFPRPRLMDTPKVINNLDKNSNLFLKAKVELFSRENQNKHISYQFALADLHCSTASIEFIPHIKNEPRKKKHKKKKKEPTPKQELRLKAHFLGKEENLYLDDSDHAVNIKVTLETDWVSKTTGLDTSKTLCISKGTRAALCFHFGGETPQLTSQFYQQFSQENDDSKRLNALLAYVGAAYFEKCGRAQESLAKSHKVGVSTFFSFGLAKFSPANPHNPQDEQRLPQVDMVTFDGPSTHGLRGDNTAYEQFSALTLVDASSNEHQILKEVFSDPYAISTVKLLQLAHTSFEKKDSIGDGFLAFSAFTLDAADRTPEIAQTMYFPHLKETSLRNVTQSLGAQWSITKNALDLNNPLAAFAYAYVTPGTIENQNGTYREMGTLLFHPLHQYALISSNTLVVNGGLGSLLSKDYFKPESIKKIVPVEQKVQKPSVPKTTQLTSDVRAGHQSPYNSVGDPVDIVTGAFYIDETDLVLPFGLEIRRNYSSQNPLDGNFGCGWKMSLNPYLVKQDGKLYAAESDGTVLTYSKNPANSRWEVSLEDNPALCNYTEHGIGSTACPFHAYIENDVLYAADGSRRFFEEGLLKKWVNAKGGVLTFFYKDKHLTRIESSNGQFCGLHYTLDGKISEIYAHDGKRISYSYNSQGELVRVILPNLAKIYYEYDRFHRIIRESKPHGAVLENIFDNQGRVLEQRSPSGQRQELVATAVFEYQDGVTIVQDACGGKTTYKIFKNQIYSIVDPLGYSTFQSWFIDKDSYFDAECEMVLAWDQPGAFPRSIKSSTDKRGLTTNYLYDDRGNPTEITLIGADLTGNGESSISKKSLYNAQDLCIEEEVLDQRTLTIYDEAFPYLPKRIEKYSQNALTSRIELTYTAFGQIEKEERSGSVTLWKYGAHGFPIEKTEISGTEDPDVVTKYAYNLQGQCTESITADAIQKNSYDIVGNQIRSQTFSPTGTLLSATYTGYNLNNQPIWQQTANTHNTLYFDYNASGFLKASRQQSITNCAYTIYEYDSRGYLTQEVDPRGFTTYREYDALGNVTCQTKEGLSTCFSYDPGGLLETIKTPSGAVTTKVYTTNGLLEKEIYPDGTEMSLVYDLFSRPIKETKNGITWEITYDDTNHRVIRHASETNTTEIYEFDLRGNVLSFTDSAGFVWKKSYDGLDRLLTDTTPTLQTSSWSYRGDTIYATLPNNEVTVTRFEAGQVVESNTFNAAGDLLAQTKRHFDPERDLEIVVQGDITTATWLNTFGLPVRVQKGDQLAFYEYDLTGNCIGITDGERRKTTKAYDGLGRMIQKKLPDGALFTFTYDSNSNITGCQLPNGAEWNATYDVMNRKCSEELKADAISSQSWQYVYEDGQLKQKIDPMKRAHTYSYDLLGRPTFEEVAGWKKQYGYDSRGLLISSELFTPSNESSLVECSYDADARLIMESIYLNSELLQHTDQTWGQADRTLRIGDHERTFSYQNNRLVKLSSKNIELSYAYDTGSLLREKNTPLTTTRIAYTDAGLPKSVINTLPQEVNKEFLQWNKSGKLANYSSSKQNKKFTYALSGRLQSAGTENYEFDFGKSGIGNRTAATNHQVKENDLFGKISSENWNEALFETLYNPMGEVVSCNQKHFEWDPWGRLLEVRDANTRWTASYDAFGRRLQTCHTTQGFIFGSSVITTSLYDPEKEFKEIGVIYNDQLFWKLYGGDSCDAVCDASGTYVILSHNTLGQLEAVIANDKTHYVENLPLSYGPQGIPQMPSDLLSYAKTLDWHSQSQDPTGLIWMGKRYYDPKFGRFLSPDPVGYPLLVNLYDYANGDPVNYMDPDGRFASKVYEPVNQRTINNINVTFADDGCGVFAKSKSYHAGNQKLSRGSIGNMNGIANNQEEAIERTAHVSNMANGVEVRGIYNASNSLAVDALECLISRLGRESAPVELYKQNWNNLIATHGPDAKFLEICHSGAADHLKNALKSSDESVRKKIIVAAFAPSVIIPNKLCYRAYNYVSRRDIVTHLDLMGKLRYGDELKILEPHPDAPLFDHDFLSPTFDQVKRKHIEEYLDLYGDKK